MLNRSASLAMSTCILKALPGKLDIKRHSPSILYLLYFCYFLCGILMSGVVLDLSFLDVCRLSYFELEKSFITARPDKSSKMTL